MSRPRKSLSYTLLAAALVLTALSAGCVRKFAINRLGDALASSGTTFSSDDDPDLIREATPFSLKLIESLLAETPRHRGLLFAASSNFTQYTYAFVHEDADEAEEQDLDKALALRARARRLYLRARNYGLRGLEVRYPDFGKAIRANPQAAVALTKPSDVPLLYWTAASWGLAISVSKDQPDLIADQPQVEALIDRALELDEDYDFGAIHGFLVERAMELSGGKLASPLVSLAETVSVRKQDRKEFESLLNKALAIDPDSKPEWRLSNLVAQRRARWLLTRTDRLFVE
jgi:predicted anti-sigma-YlaC factor YlaD